MPYQYVTSINRYRNTATGQFVPRETVMAYVDRIIGAGGDASETLASLWADGTLSAHDFGVQMRDELKSTYIQQYILGRGGRESMTFADWGRVGRDLREQYRLLQQFVEDIEAGNQSEKQVRHRARMYFDTSRMAYEQGNAAAHGVNPRDLPSMPGDEHQTCYGGCRCAWRFEKVFDEDGTLIAIHAFWELDFDAEHCEPTESTRGCVQNSIEYNPFVIQVGAGE